jgi:EAL and modified HD-GYP domain-containing signal transduction protein
VTFDEALFRHCNDLRRAGFRVALDDVSQVSPRLLAFLPCVDIVKIDFIGRPRECLAELIGAVRQQGKVSIAEKVETPEDHDAAMRAGFELFQGYYFAKPQMLRSRLGTSPPGVDGSRERTAPETVLPLASGSLSPDSFS